MSRDIPSLFTICLRNLGSHDCNTEKTFAPRKTNGKEEDENENAKTKPLLSTASILLKFFHKRSSILPPMMKMKNGNNNNKKSSSTTTSSSNTITKISDIPIKRAVCGGTPGSTRRAHANDVDINHPFIGSCSYFEENNNSSDNSSQENNCLIVQEYSNTALDCLQSYIDALVEQGRMDDTRLGKYFFDEWCRCASLGTYNGISTFKTDKEKGDDDGDDDDHNDDDDDDNNSNNENEQIINNNSKSNRGSSSKKRKRTPTPTKQKRLLLSNPSGQQKYKSSLSLLNCSIGDETLEIMVKHKDLGKYLNVLDMTGMMFLTDIHIKFLLKNFVNIQRLSLKNCRRLTGKTMVYVSHNIFSSKLTCLDIGGSINIHPNDVLSALGDNDDVLLPNLNELYASGLGWNDTTLMQLITKRNNWIGLGIGFSNPIDTNGQLHAPSMTASSTGISSNGLRDAFAHLEQHTLQRLAIPFIENSIDNAILGYLGKNFGNLKVLDIRGNTSVNSLTAWYDGRFAQGGEGGSYEDDDNNESSYSDIKKNDSLFVLARYTSITSSSIEETKRIYPLRTTKLNCILDGNGTGGGITRT